MLNSNISNRNEAALKARKNDRRGRLAKSLRILTSQQRGILKLFTLYATGRSIRRGKWQERRSEVVNVNKTETRRTKYILASTLRKGSLTIIEWKDTREGRKLMIMIIVVKAETGITQKTIKNERKGMTIAEISKTSKTVTTIAIKEGEGVNDRIKESVMTDEEIVNWMTPKRKTAETFERKWLEIRGMKTE
jgi:hypothetical protein